MYQGYQSKGSVHRFDTAISKSNKLVGLARGVLERNRLTLKVHAMEVSSETKSLANRMLEITLYAAGVYSKFNQTPKIWLCNSVSPACVRLYSGQGYEPNYDRFGRCTHLIKKVK